MSEKLDLDELEKRVRFGRFERREVQDAIARLREAEAEREILRRELQTLCEEQPGFSWQDYREGLHADEACQFLRDLIDALVEDNNRLRTRTETE